MARCMRLSLSTRECSKKLATNYLKKVIPFKTTLAQTMTNIKIISLLLALTVDYPISTSKILSVALRDAARSKMLTDIKVVNIFIFHQILAID